MKTQFTPGPWYVMTEKNGAQWVGNKKGENCCVQKNASLIAAAPELYELLHDCLVYVTDTIDCSEDKKLIARAKLDEARIRAAIAKAKGELC